MNMKWLKPVRIFTIIAYFVVLLPTLQGQVIYQLQYPYASAYSGADFHLLIHHELTSLENHYIPGSILKSPTVSAKAGNILYRMLKMGTLDFYLAYIPVINQHEYFGHLVRAKQFHAGFTRYEIYFFPPSGGMAYYGNHAYQPLTITEMNMENMGGIESTSILSRSLARNILLKNYCTYQESMLYLGARTDLATYVLFEEESSHNDIDKYLYNLNTTFPEREIDKQELVFPALITLAADPVMLLSVYNILVQYIWRGGTGMPVRMLNNQGAVSLFPVLSLELGPLGPLYNLENYVRLKGHLYSAGIQKNAMDINPRFGIQCAAFGLGNRNGKFRADLGVRYWHEKGTTYHLSSTEIFTSRSDGGLITGTLYYFPPVRPVAGRHWLVSAEAGIKTDGYTPGYPIGKGITFHVGLGYSLY